MPDPYLTTLSEQAARDYNEPISDAGHVVGDGLVQRIADLEKQLILAIARAEAAERKLSNFLTDAGAHGFVPRVPGT